MPIYTAQGAFTSAVLLCISDLLHSFIQACCIAPAGWRFGVSMKVLQLVAELTKYMPWINFANTCVTWLYWGAKQRAFGVAMREVLDVVTSGFEKYVDLEDCSKCLPIVSLINIKLVLPSASAVVLSSGFPVWVCPQTRDKARSIGGQCWRLAVMAPDMRPCTPKPPSLGRPWDSEDLLLSWHGDA